MIRAWNVVVALALVGLARSVPATDWGGGVQMECTTCYGNAKLYLLDSISNPQLFPEACVQHNTTNYRSACSSSACQVGDDLIACAGLLFEGTSCSNRDVWVCDCWADNSTGLCIDEPGCRTRCNKYTLSAASPPTYQNLGSNICQNPRANHDGNFTYHVFAVDTTGMTGACNPSMPPSDCGQSPCRISGCTNPDTGNCNRLMHFVGCDIDVPN